MKVKIKKILKKIPFVKNCIDYRNMRNRKTKLQYLLKHNAERYQTSKYDGNSLVSIIILNRNGVDKLKDLMRSFKKSDFYQNFEIVFVDNASTDESVQYMKKWKDTYDIHIICNDRNCSFSVANNQAANMAKGEYLLFLNNDTAVTDGWLDALLLAAEQLQDVGVLGARLIYPEVTGEKKKAYAIQHEGILFKDAMRKKHYFIRPYNLTTKETAYDIDITPIERVAVTAAVLLIKSHTYRLIGGFSEQYCYGLEDVDLGLKLHKMGYHNYYCPGCLVYHYEFGTREFKSAEAQKRGEHNTSVFQGKWQRYLWKQMLLDKINGTTLFTKQSLQIAIACSNSATSENVRCLEKQLLSRGYDVRYLNPQDEEKYYDIGPTTDVIILLDTGYQLGRMSNYKNDLLVFSTNDYLKEKSGIFLYKVPMHELAENVDWLTASLCDMIKDEITPNMIDICGCMPNDHNKKHWGDYHFARSMKSEFEKRGYKVNILTKDEWYRRSDAKYTIFLRGNREYYPSVEDGKKFIMWNISHPAEVSKDEYNAFDFVFFASDKLQDQYGSQIDVESDVLMQCADENVMKVQETLDRKYELLFVGNSRRVYRQILKDLLPTKHHLTVIGRHWEEYPVQEYVVSDYIANDQVGQAYHDAKILLNDHWEDMKEQGVISNRIFDALAAKAFVISDYMPEIESVFQGAVVTYSDKVDLERKIDYYLQHENERLEKARIGQSIVLREHTFSKRIEKIIEVMKKL